MPGEGIHKGRVQHHVISTHRTPSSPINVALTATSHLCWWSWGFLVSKKKVLNLSPNLNSSPSPSTKTLSIRLIIEANFIMK